MEYLLHIDRTEVLFRDIYSMFIQGDKQELFLQLLEPYILSDRYFILLVHPPQCEQPRLMRCTCDRTKG